MRFRMGMTVGFAAGYVMGAKAGRDRYDQLMRSWREFRSSDQAQQLEDSVRSVATQAKEQASEQVGRVTELVKDKVRGDDDQVGGNGSAFGPAGARGGTT